MKYNMKDGEIFTDEFGQKRICEMIKDCLARGIRVIYPVDNNGKIIDGDSKFCGIWSD